MAEHTPHRVEVNQKCKNKCSMEIKRKYKYVFFGDGLSTLISIDTFLNDNRNVTPKEILILGIREKFGLPVHFGTSLNSFKLLNNTVKSSSSELLPFADWIKQNKNVSKMWPYTLYDQINIQDSYVPRRWFGEFLSEKYSYTIDRISSSIDFVSVQNKSVSISSNMGKFELFIDNELKCKFDLGFIATGNPCPFNMHRVKKLDSCLPLKSSKKLLDLPKGSIVGVVGAGASTAELIYEIHAKRNLDIELHVFSADGFLPNSGRCSDSVQFTRKVELYLHEGKAKKLAFIIKRYLEEAKAECKNYDFSNFTSSFLSDVEKMDEQEKRIFLSSYSREIKLMLRWCPPAYYSAISNLIKHNALSLKHARVTDVKKSLGGKIIYTNDTPSPETHIYDEVINCSIPNDYTTISLSKNIETAVNNATYNNSKDGFVFEIFPKLFVLGNCVSEFSFNPKHWGRIDSAIKCAIIAKRTAQYCHT